MAEDMIKLPEGNEEGGYMNMINNMKLWHKFFMAHRYIPAAELDLLDPQMITSNCYKFILKNIGNITYIPSSPRDKLTSLKLKLFITFYSKKQSKYFGRTCETQALELDQDHTTQTYFLKQEYPFCLYYHTKLSTDSATSMIMEVHIYEMGENDVVYTSKALGYVEIPALTSTTKDKIILMKKGSPRDLMSSFIPQQQNLQAQFLFTLEEHGMLRQITHLMPDSIILSTYDILPGIQRQLLPNSAIDQQLKCQPTATIFITGLKVVVPQQVEVDIIRQIQSFLKVTGHNVNAVNVQDRICLNNKYSLRASLNDEQNNLVYSYAGRLELDSVFQSELSVVILQYNYEIEITTDTGKQHINKTAGWIPIHINDKIGLERLQIHDILFKGPGKTVEGKKMFQISQKEEQSIKIICEFNLSETNDIKAMEERIKEQDEIHKYGGDIQEKQGQKQDYGGQGYKKKAYDVQTDLMQNIAMEQMQSQIEELNRKNQVLETQLNKLGLHNTGLQYQMLDQQKEISSRMYQLQPLILPVDQNMAKIQLHSVIKDLQEREAALLELIQKEKDQKEELRIKQEEEFQFLKKGLEESNQEQMELRNIPIIREANHVAQKGILTKQQTLHEIYHGQNTYVDFSKFDVTNYMMKPQIASKRITKIDKLNLAKNNIKGILENQLQPDNINIPSQRIDYELSDQLQVNNIQIEFIGINPVFFNFENADIDKTRRILSDPRRQSDFMIPRKFYFVYKFYDFPEEKTKNLVFKDVHEDDVMNRALSIKEKDMLMLVTEEESTIQRIIEEERKNMREEIKFYSILQNLTKKKKYIDIRYISFYISHICMKQKQKVLKRNNSNPNLKELPQEHTQQIQQVLPIQVYREIFQNICSLYLQIYNILVKIEYKDNFYQLYNILHMVSKSMQIDIYDADTFFHFGVCRIQLNQLLRDQKQRIKKMDNIAILEPSFCRIKGFLVVSLTNKGTKPTLVETQQQDVPDNVSQKSGSNLDFNQGNQHVFYRKVISNEPLQIPENYEEEMRDKNKTHLIIQEIQDDNLRKQEIVKKFKMKQMQGILKNQQTTSQIKYVSGQDQMENKDAQIKLKIVQEISHYKDLRKKEYLKNILKEMVPSMNTIKLNPHYGQALVFHYEISNPNKKGQGTNFFKITIQDPDEEFLYEKELTLITDPDDWEYWVRKEHYPPPSDNNYDQIKKDTLILNKGDKGDPKAIQQTNKKEKTQDQYIIKVEEGEKITVLFQYITYRQPDETLDQKSEEESYQNATEQYKNRFQIQRTITVNIMEKDGKVQKSSFNVEVYPRRPIIDQNFKYLEKAGSHCQIVLPQLFNQTQAPQEVQTFHNKCTLENVLVRFIDNNNILIETHTPDTQQTIEFYVIIYKNKFKGQIISSWKIEVTGVEALDMNVKMGQSVNFPLWIPAQEKSMFGKIVTTHPNMVKSVSPKIAIEKQLDTKVLCEICSLKSGEQITQINCVNISTGELIYSWLLDINTITPSPSFSYTLYKQKKQKFGVQAPTQFNLNDLSLAVDDSVQNIPYTNSSYRILELQFKSSNPYLVSVHTENIVLKSQQSTDITLTIEEIDEIGEYFCYLFVQDKQKIQFDTIELRVICYEKDLENIKNQMK